VKEKEFLENFSPTAWSHLNLLGYYQFLNKIDEKSYEKQLERWIQSCDLRKMMDLVEKSKGRIPHVEAKQKKSETRKPS